MALYEQEPAIESTNIADAAGVNLATVSATGALKIDGSAVTQPVSAASLPLPTGAASASNQTTEIASLASIDAGIPAALGQTVMTSSMPVVIASDQTQVSIRFPDRTLLAAGQLFGFSIEQNQASTGEQNLILFRNPSASGKTVYITKINCGSVDTLTRFKIRVYQKPSVSAVGTAGTIFSYQIKASPPSSVCLVYTVPSISAKGTKIRSYSQADTGSKWEDFRFGISLEAGQDILITGDTDASNKILFADFQWSEE